MIKDLECFPFCQTKQSETSGIIKKNVTTLFDWKKKSNRSDPFGLRPKFWLLLNKEGLETRIFGNWTASFGRIWRIWRWGHFDQKFPRWPRKCSIYFSTEISENVGMGKHPLSHLRWPLHWAATLIRRTRWPCLLHPSQWSLNRRGRKRTQTILFAKSIGDNSPVVWLIFVVYSGLANRTDSGCK